MKTVTPDDAAERKREQVRLRVQRLRERQRAAAQAQAPLLFETADWQQFLRPETLPQKAGCEPDQIGRIVLKEITDNALDTGSVGVRVELIDDESDMIGYRVTDHAPDGIDPAKVPEFFAVNRPLLSSKLQRLPLRGMLGNGLRVVMGAVAAFGGTITVTSKGHRQTLAIDTVTGKTSVASNKLTRPVDGTVVEITLPIFDGHEFVWAKLALDFAYSGTQYTGPSQPSWYSLEDVRFLCARVTPPTTTVARLVRNVFNLKLDDDRSAASLTADDVAALHQWLRTLQGSRRVPMIGCIGNDAGEHYNKTDGVARIGGAEVPFCVECWATCRRAERSDHTGYNVLLLLNRSPSVAPLQVSADSEGLWLRGCGLNQMITGRRAHYTLVLSLITPHVRLTGDGKAPFLADFGDEIRRAVQKAAGSAYRAMVKPPKTMTVIEAAYQVMEKAYLAASENLPGRPGRLTAKARQIMYAARGDILDMAGTFTDNYFTQTCLPDYVDEHPEETADWKVAFDARGSMAEPHTRLSFGLGTTEVDAYLEGRPRKGPAAGLSTSLLYPTYGPENRYKVALYIEKQGFDELMEDAQIQERFDMMVMSNKGMSVTATRKLIDNLFKRGVEKIFVLHDFDLSGFSILGTIGTSARRYKFQNKVPVIDVGLTLQDIQRMGLQSEPYTVGKKAAKPETTRRNGATPAELRFLYGPNLDGVGARRVELNAMTSRQIVELLERKFAEHGVTKLMPDRAIIEEHARRLYRQEVTKAVLDKAQPEIDKLEAAYKPPRWVVAKASALVAKRPELPWDEAVAVVLGVRD